MKQFGVTSWAKPISQCLSQSAPITTVVMGMESCEHGHPHTKEHSMHRPCSKDLGQQLLGGLEGAFRDRVRLWKACLGGACEGQSVGTCLEASFYGTLTVFPYIAAMLRVSLSSHHSGSLLTSHTLSLSGSLGTLWLGSSHSCSFEPFGRDTEAVTFILPGG